MVLTEQQKIEFAILVRDNKHLLFGSFDGGMKITNHTKHRKWEEIFLQLVSNGAAVKSLNHLRNVSLILHSSKCICCHYRFNENVFTVFLIAS